MSMLSRLFGGRDRSKPKGRKQNKKKSFLTNSTPFPQPLLMNNYDKSVRAYRGGGSNSNYPGVVVRRRVGNAWVPTTGRTAAASRQSTDTPMPHPLYMNNYRQYEPSGGASQWVSNIAPVRRQVGNQWAYAPATRRTR